MLFVHRNAIVSAGISVCLFAFLLCRELFIQSTSHVAGVLLRTQGSAVSHFGTKWTCYTFRINKLLMNEWMMHLYRALLCIAIHPKRFTIMWGRRVSPQPPPVRSIHLDDATAATGQRHQCAHHTPTTGGGERVIETIKCMGIIRRPWLTRASGGNLARTLGLPPYALREVPWRTSVWRLIQKTDNKLQNSVSWKRHASQGLNAPRTHTALVI